MGSECRKIAREKLAGKWKNVAITTLVYFLITMVISTLINKIFGNESVLGSLISSAISVPMTFGLIDTFLKFYNQEDAELINFLKTGFGNFVRAWKVAFYTFLKMIVPCVALIVTILVLGLVFVANKSLVSIVIVILVAVIVWVYARSLALQLAVMIAVDNPSLDEKECVLKSMELMKGNCGKLLLLELSFIGWAILACFTAGIGMFWLAGYIQVSLIAFYKKLAGDSGVSSDDSNEFEATTF